MKSIPGSALGVSAMAVMLLAVASCMTEPELPTVAFEGRVLENGTPVAAGTATVMLIDSRQRFEVSAPTGADGSYRLEQTPMFDLCSSWLIAFRPGSPFPTESDRHDGMIDLPSGSRCEGVVRGPDIELPEPTAELDSARVLGTVTRNGEPASVVVTLFVESYAWGPEVLATTTTDDEGRYEVSGAVPRYYCDDLQLRTDPPANAFYSPGGCSASLVDIDLGG